MYNSYKKPVPVGKRLYNSSTSGGPSFRQPMGNSNYISPTDEKCQQEMLKKMDSCNTLTICHSKNPEYYLQLIRHHFKKRLGDDPLITDPSKRLLCLQALGLSCQNLVFVACLVNLKGYASYHRIKNDSLSVPVQDATSGQQMGWVKKVRLTVKLQISDNFRKIMEAEDLVTKAQSYKQASSVQVSKQTTEEQKSIGSKNNSVSEDFFDKEDLVLKNSQDAHQQMISMALTENDILGEFEHQKTIDNDINFNFGDLISAEDGDPEEYDDEIEEEEEVEEGELDRRNDFFPDEERQKIEQAEMLVASVTHHNTSSFDSMANQTLNNMMMELQLSNQQSEQSKPQQVPSVKIEVRGEGGISLPNSSPTFFMKPSSPSTTAIQ